MAFTIFSCRFLAGHVTLTRTWELNSHHQQSPMRVEGIHTYDGVLPGTPKESFATLLSPPQCHADFGTMPHTLASVDQIPVRRFGTLPH
jgi:hypothetical protein